MILTVRKAFGLPADPWSRLEAHTGDFRRIGEAVRAAAEASLFVSILGARGDGKTRAVRAACRAYRGSLRAIQPLRLTRERLHMGDIERALLRDLAPDEHPRRSAEARSEQCRRVLGRRSADSAILLILDDSHVMHHSTIRALKRLRELEWTGVSPLLGILLVGQADRARRLPEVGLRSDSLWCAGLSEEEAESAIAEAINVRREVIDEEARRLIAQSKHGRNWLDLQRMTDETLAAAQARGQRQAGEQAALDALRPDKRPAPDVKRAPIDAGTIERMLERRSA